MSEEDSLIDSSRHQRTPLEILSTALDRLLLNYAVLPWRHTCQRCARRARFRCERCGETFCPSHAKAVSGLRVVCKACVS
jgi:formylmethanofuran dehydrogenase subunit E